MNKTTYEWPNAILFISERFILFLTVVAFQLIL